MKIKFYIILYIIILLLTTLCIGCSNHPSDISDPVDEQTYDNKPILSFVEQDMIVPFLNDNEHSDVEQSCSVDAYSEITLIYDDLLLSNRIDSENFIIIFSDIDAFFAEDVMHTLEENLERVLSFLQLEVPSRSVVYIYPDIESFHIGAFGEIIEQYVGDKVCTTLTSVINDPIYTGVTGAYIDNTIVLLSPNYSEINLPYEIALASAIHEFVHLASSLINNQPPIYLQEGLATFLSGEYDLVFMEGEIGKFISSLISEQNFPSVPLLTRLNFPYPYLHFYSYLFSEYIITEYGSEVFMELYKNPDLAQVIGKRTSVIHHEWMDYLNEKYDLNN